MSEAAEMGKALSEMRSTKKGKFLLLKPIGAHKVIDSKQARSLVSTHPDIDRVLELTASAPGNYTELCDGTILVCIL